MLDVLRLPSRACTVFCHVEWTPVIGRENSRISESVRPSEGSSWPEIAWYAQPSEKAPGLESEALLPQRALRLANPVSCRKHSETGLLTRGWRAQSRAGRTRIRVC